MVREGTQLWRDYPWKDPFKSFRGTGIPRESLAFFTEGKEYRAGMFLATSLEVQVPIEKFLIPHMASWRNAKPAREPTLFTIEFSQTLRCNHVNYISQEMSAVNDESE